MFTLYGFSGNKYEFLSNFYACQVFYKNDIDTEGFLYPTSEHAFQAAKATNIEDMHYIGSASTPAEAKRRGRSVKLRADWDQIKDRVMLDILRIKFHNPEMSERMLNTIDDGIEAFCEGNWWHDNYWGNCDCPRCSSIFGQNRLGMLLMQVRAEVRKEKEAQENT